jgi:hypothetical protein
LHDLEAAVGKIDGTATVAAVADPLLGQRLVGEAGQRDMVAAALDAVGINPLVAAAFRERDERVKSPEP